jgi:hypothetical protein
MPGCTESFDPFDCILFTSEDSESNSVKLIELHNGDPSRVHIHDIAEAKDFIDIAKRVADLERFIREHSVKLIVLDAMNSFVGGDISTDSKARRQVSGPLASLAKQTGATIVGIRNWGRQDNGSASNNSMGSHSVSDVARVVLNTEIVPETEDSEEFTQLVWEKLSDGKQPKPLRYRVRDLSDGSSENAYHRVIVWDKESAATLAENLKNGRSKKGVRKRSQKRGSVAKR